MLRAWQIVKRRHAENAFDGEGTRLYGGRWNTPGRGVVYVSDTRALATLEVLAGLETTGPIGEYVLIGVEFADALVSGVDPNDLPQGWDATPPSSPSQAIGDDWLEGGASAVLRVPSVVIPAEFNYLLNPAHPDFAKIRIGEAEDLHFDPRLLSS